MSTRINYKSFWENQMNYKSFFGENNVTRLTVNSLYYLTDSNIPIIHCLEDKVGSVRSKSLFYGSKRNLSYHIFNIYFSCIIKDYVMSFFPFLTPLITSGTLTDISIFEYFRVLISFLVLLFHMRH